MVPCVLTVFFCHGKKHYQLSLYRASYPFQWWHLQPTEMVGTTEEICSKLQPRTTEPLYSTLFCMRCQRGAGPSLCESWQNISSLGFHDATQGLRVWNLFHLITRVDHWWSLYISTQFIHFKRHFGIPHSFFEFEPAMLITPRNADLALQVSNIQQTRFQLDRKGLLLLASNSVLNLHFFMALPGRVIPIMIHDMSLMVWFLVCKSGFNKDNKVYMFLTFSVHDFCFNPPFSHPSLKVLPRGASYMPGNVELKRVELHRRLMNSQDWKIHPNWDGYGVGLWRFDFLNMKKVLLKQ